MPTRWDAEIPRAAGLQWGYRDQLIAYRKRWSADLCAITGQSGELPMFTYQTLGPAGDAQLMAADADPSIYMIGPHYAVPSALNSRTTLGRHGDAIHLSAESAGGESRWEKSWTEYESRRRLATASSQEADLADARDSVAIDFTVPHPPLVLDTDFLPRQEIAENGGFTSLAGFQVRDASGQPVTLASIEVVAPTQVRLRFVHPLPAGQTCSVSYGHPFTSALGTIAAIRIGPVTDAQATQEIVLGSSYATQLKALTDEGASLLCHEHFWPPGTRPDPQGARRKRCHDCAAL